MLKKLTTRFTKSNSSHFTFAWFLVAGKAFFSFRKFTIINGRILVTMNPSEIEFFIYLVQKLINPQIKNLLK